jgi:predicted DNA-binding transcriptional regulator AlpA
VQDWQDPFTNVKGFGEDVAVPKSPEHEGSPRLMSISQIAEEHGVSRVSIHAYRRRGDFPQPVSGGEGTTRLRWRADEVAAWFAANPKQPGKRTDLAAEPAQGEPVITTIDARSDLYAFAMQGKENSPTVSDRASEKIDAYRETVIAEVVEALQAKGAELSELAEEKMQPSVEERAQTWYEAADVAEKLKRAKPGSQE